MKTVRGRFFRLIFSAAVVCTLACASQEEPQDWARGIVWYQIFPERFRNGIPGNDPTVAEVPEAEMNPHWRVHPWTSDWFERQPWENMGQKSFYDFNVVFARRYGGDLIGVIEKLDYLKELGIDGIYFNPVFEAESLHKYDGASYHHIDDNFGPDPAGDRARIAAADETEDPSTWIWTAADSTFLELLKQAHDRDIKIVIDGVFNHTGRAFFAFKDILENGESSRYVNWYDILSWDDPGTPKNEFAYECWWNVPTLPVFSEDENGLVSGPREYVFAATKRWMDPNGDGDPSDGIDGWRLDVINEVAPEFWRKWSALVDSLNPAAITVAEIWDDASMWINECGIDNTMNYLFARASVDFFIDVNTGLTGTEFAERLQSIAYIYGRDTAHILWNLYDSHDTDRLASMIINPERDYDRDNRPAEAPDYEVRAPNAQERLTQKQMIVFQLTYIGAPMIYYGSEAGMYGPDDPDERKPMLWEDLEYDVEKSHPLPNRTRPADPNIFDRDLFEFYRKMIALRHEMPALMYGDFEILPETSAEDVFGFSRSDGSRQVIVLFNRSSQQTRMTVAKSSCAHTRYVTPFSSKKYKVTGDGLELVIPASGYLILLSR